MMKSALTIMVLCGTVSAAFAMPVPAISADNAISTTKAAVVVKKTIVHRRRAPVIRHRTVVRKTIIR